MSETSAATTAGDVQDMPQEHAAATEISEWQEVPRRPATPVVAAVGAVGFPF